MIYALRSQVTRRKEAICRHDGYCSQVVPRSTADVEIEWSLMQRDKPECTAYCSSMLETMAKQNEIQELQGKLEPD